MTTRTKGFIRPAAGLLAGVAMLAAAGCAQRADGSFVSIVDDAQVLTMSAEGLNETERRQLERVQRYAEMRVTGAAGGALTGALAGALLARDNPAAGVAIGVTAGAALGYLAGAYVANLNEQAEDRRDDLNTQLGAAKQAVAENKRAVADNRDIVSAQTRAIDDLNRRFRAGTVTKEQYAAQIEGLDTRMTIVDESLRAAENDVAAIERSAAAREKAGDTRGAQQLTAQKTALQSDVNRLQQEKLRLVEAVASIPPEVGGPSV